MQLLPEQQVYCFNIVFFQVFDAYAQFEESMISAKMETTSEMGPSEEGILVPQYSFEINQN